MKDNFVIQQCKKSRFGRYAITSDGQCSYSMSPVLKELALFLAEFLQFLFLLLLLCDFLTDVSENFVAPIHYIVGLICVPHVSISMYVFTQL